jgi:hypothetical protein
MIMQLIFKYPRSCITVIYTYFQCYYFIIGYISNWVGIRNPDVILSYFMQGWREGREMYQLLSPYQKSYGI